ncbi:MAG: DUF4011 domain-containing protein [Planctomycetaceae bacterium]
MSNSSIEKQLEVARRDLLELTTRNRLLNCPRHQSRGASIELAGLDADRLFQLCVLEGKRLRFAAPQSTDDGSDEIEPSETSEDIDSAIEQVPDTSGEGSQRGVLQVEVSRKELDRRLLRLVTDAAAMLQEQGANLLYLALGFLRWFEESNPEIPRHAPLLLLPVKLQRHRAGERFTLEFAGDELETNLTLKTRLQIDLGIELPEVPETDECVPTKYFEQVRDAIKNLPKWEVLADEGVLWFFSFTKLLMYRDLDPDNWPAESPIVERPLLRSLMHDGFQQSPPICGDEELIDDVFSMAAAGHVVDCDSSQALVVEEARRGESLVVQGPPGTGKSQTITNIISSLVRDGKTVLFVSEKMAALEVVQRRMENIGLGNLCLELHSNKTKKRDVLQEIEKTLHSATSSTAEANRMDVTRWESLAHRLNLHAVSLHKPDAVSGLTPYEVIAELIALRAGGAVAPTFQLSAGRQWSAADYESGLRHVLDFVSAFGTAGDPQTHTWRGCGLRDMLPFDLERMLQAVPGVVQAIEKVRNCCRNVAEHLGEQQPENLSEAARLIRTAQTVLDAPQLDVSAFQDEVWELHVPQIAEIGGAAMELDHTRQILVGVVNESAWQKDVKETHQNYYRWSRSPLRFVMPAYYRAQAELNSILINPASANVEQRERVLDLLLRAQNSQERLQKLAPIGKLAFGSIWLDDVTNWSMVKNITSWNAKTSLQHPLPNWRELLSRLKDREGLQPLVEAANAALSKLVGLATDVMQQLNMNVEEMFDAPGGDAFSAGQLGVLNGLAGVSWSNLEERLQQWQESPERLQHWSDFLRARELVMHLADGQLVQWVEQHSPNTGQAKEAFRYAYLESVFRACCERIPELHQFRGEQHDVVIQDFCQLDAVHLQEARKLVANAHAEGIVRLMQQGPVQQLNLLRHEMKKKRRHLPLRQLIQLAGDAVRTIKPVFMMSPLSVAKYLEPGAVEFDVLLIDEASQVRPVESLGAVARCRQMVVVGDDKQMPPTSFFNIAIGDSAVDDEQEANDMQVGDVESILGLSASRNMSQRMLQWHYRSRHQSLIAVSNREFYDNRLWVIPSPDRGGDVGLKWRPVEGGHFSNGVNRVEAAAVADAVMRHAAECPELTLGVGAFSISQRDAIIEELEKRRREGGNERFFDSEQPHPFFVKNLENIQGDERDVIFVSVGYGPDENGRVSLNFGPVSASGGERRLNVLMTRAKLRLEVFSSMQPEDLDLRRTSSRGTAVFRAFLEYARDGGAPTATEHHSKSDTLAECVSRALHEHGYQTEGNVGIAGVFVDLAVVDPSQPDRYLLGIEFDGTSYRSARSARDRDRTRAAVLKLQGWELHRIWSVDWFHRPQEQLERLVMRLEKLQPASDN